MRLRVPRLLILAVVATAASSDHAFGQDAQKAPGPAARPKPGPPAKAATAPAQSAPNDPRMKQLLAAWEKQSAKIRTLDVKIKRVDQSAAWGNEEFEGRALLESPNHAWLDFKKVDADEKGNKKLIPHERIICTGNEIWQYKPEVKQVFI
ncbi:MAG: outer membrane lipoprotein-sorting protein, partial [Planctomycetia bacterium]|nr:outer membrane lipoprotein-sorting protein [Planctomycetia bacterium]